MNCRPGDLAVVIRNTNIGKIVKCVRLHTSETHDVDGLPFDRSDGPRWVLDRTLFGRKGAPLQSLPDAALRPIRDTDGQDEMIRIAGKPREAVEG